MPPSFMERVVQPELLDILPARDGSALRSRRDIGRLNSLMGHPRLMAMAVEQSWRGKDRRRIVELGAGDGRFLSSVARRMRSKSSGVHATLVDRLDVLEPATRDEFASLGWQIDLAIADATEWLSGGDPFAGGTIIANLFLHQFTDAQLSEMLGLAARSADSIIALEPRRSRLSRFCGCFLGLAGCSRVTRHDGRISIRAGFTGRELSALWRGGGDWDLAERPVGWFSHLFIAWRKS
jgi:hypothetical protein